MAAPSRPPLRDTLPFLHLVPNLVTILGLCAGLSAIRFVFDGRFEIAAGLIIFAAIIDGLDGLIARKLNAASAFGAELDSLADFVNFGVAPGVLVFAFALTGPMAGLGWAFVLSFAVCSCLRLARFNVNRDAPSTGKGQHFVGVPAPAGAMLALLPVFLGLSGIVDLSRMPIVVAGYLAGVGLLMISRLPTPSLKGVRVPRDRAVWVMVGCAVVVGLAFTRIWLLLVLADLAYLVLLSVVAIRRSRALRRQ